MKTAVSYAFLAIVITFVLVYFAPRIAERLDATFGNISRVLRTKDQS